jgi:hypothetical protein
MTRPIDVGTMNDTTQADARQAELGQVRRGISGPYNPRTPAPPPVPAMQAEADAREHHAGIERIRTRHEPPDALHVLLRRQALVWMLWGSR